MKWTTRQVHKVRKAPILTSRLLGVGRRSKRAAPVAKKVVGMGNVGTRCLIVLLED